MSTLNGEIIQTVHYTKTVYIYAS